MAILILKIISFFLSTFLGILSLIFNFKDEEKKLNGIGKTILIFMIVAFFISISITVIEIEEGKNDAINQLSRTNQVLNEFNRTQTPITRLKITYWLELPKNNIEVQNYITSLDKYITNNMDKVMEVELPIFDEVNRKFVSSGLRSSVIGFNRPLKNYLHCRCGVKNRLKMLIYHA